jgi:hypothetical protein
MAINPMMFKACMEAGGYQWTTRKQCQAMTPAKGPAVLENCDQVEPPSPRPPGAINGVNYRWYPAHWSNDASGTCHPGHWAEVGAP